MSALTDLEADVAWFRDQRDQLRREYDARVAVYGPVATGLLQFFGDTVTALENELERMKKEPRK